MASRMTDSTFARNLSGHLAYVRTWRVLVLLSSESDSFCVYCIKAEITDRLDLITPANRRRRRAQMTGSTRHRDLIVWARLLTVRSAV